MGGNVLIPMTTLLIAMAALTLAVAARAALDPEIDRLTPAPSAPLTLWVQLSLQRANRS